MIRLIAFVFFALILSACASQQTADGNGRNLASLVGYNNSAKKKILKYFQDDVAGNYVLKDQSTPPCKGLNGLKVGDQIRLRVWQVDEEMLVNGLVGNYSKGDLNVSLEQQTADGKWQPAFGPFYFGRTDFPAMGESSVGKFASKSSSTSLTFNPTRIEYNESSWDSSAGSRSGQIVILEFDHEVMTRTASSDDWKTVERCHFSKSGQNSL